MPLVTVDSEIAFIERGRVWRAEAGSASVTASTNFLLGILTGSRQIVVTTRSYVSSSPRLVAGLYEAAFTGGSPARTLNRRLESPDSAPFTVTQGVTASLGAVITQATILAGVSTGNAQASFFGDTFAIILEPNTSYVVALFNGGAQLAEIGMAFDARTDEKLTTHNERP